MPRFVDTYALVYAEERDAGPKHQVARDLIVQLRRKRRVLSGSLPPVSDMVMGQPDMRDAAARQPELPAADGPEAISEEADAMSEDGSDAHATSAVAS